MNCIYCSSTLPDKGFYCPKCAKQNKCKECKEELVADAKVCVFCGTEVGESQSHAVNMNTIEFSETETTRKFKATFTDTVGQGISETFGSIIANKVGGKKTQHLNLPAPQTNGAKTEDVPHLEIKENGSAGDAVVAPDLETYQKIFKVTDTKTILEETRLKAKSKLDFGKRLTLLFLHFRSLQNLDDVPRPDLTALLNDASVADGNLRRWIAKNPLIGVGDNTLHIKAPGKQEAKKIMEEVFNPAIECSWKLGSAPRAYKASKGKEKKSVDK